MLTCPHCAAEHGLGTGQRCQDASQQNSSCVYRRRCQGKRRCLQLLSVPSITPGFQCCLQRKWGQRCLLCWSSACGCEHWNCRSTTVVAIPLLDCIVILQLADCCSTSLHALKPNPFLLQEGAEGKIAAGALLGAYEATRFKSKVKAVTTLEQVEVLVPPKVDVAAGQKAVDHAVAMAKGALLTRCVSREVRAVEELVMAGSLPMHARHTHTQNAPDSGSFRKC